MRSRWAVFGSLWLATALIGQDDAVVRAEVSKPLSLEAVSDPAQNPAGDLLSSPSRLRQEATTPAVIDLERSGLQPLSGDTAIVGGQWVSPQLVLGGLSAAPRAEQAETVERVLADATLQPMVSRWPSELALGLDQRFEGKLVKRYSEARVVRFLAPRDSLQNLFDEVGLDDLNRYQFRRNRPDTVPVERVGE